MRRLAGCLVVSVIASAAAWVGCRDDLGDEDLSLVAGSGTVGLDAIVVSDDVGSGAGSDAAVVPDTGGDGPMGSDAPIADAGSGEGGPGSDGGVGGDAYGGGTDARTDGGTDGGGGIDDDGGGGRPDARRGAEIDSLDRTSFYACAGGPASAGLEVGLPIGLALAIAGRRRRRWRPAGTPDRAP